MSEINTTVIQNRMRCGFSLGNVLQKQPKFWQSYSFSILELCIQVTVCKENWYLLFLIVLAEKKSQQTEIK